MKFLTFFFCYIFGACFLHAQHTDTFPKNYFRNPLDIPVSLAGNFGEFRPNHFHTGIDFKTNQQENLRVRAAAEGYVFRVAVSHSGYGNAIYINHPNGYTTVYAHLNDFYPELQQYVKQMQYANESWQLNLMIPADSFPVKKGQFIAFSGNTGGSTAPHLHFEIRHTATEQALNGMLFGFPITDTKAPIAKKIAIYDGAVSIYEQNPSTVSLIAKGANKYETATPILTTNNPTIKIGIFADDYMEGSTNTLGIYETKLFLDNELQCNTKLTAIDFAHNRCMNAFADFKLKKEQNTWYQSLFKLPGNKLEVYTFLNKTNGVLDISDGNQHRIIIEMIDAQSNKSLVHFTVQYKPGNKTDFVCKSDKQLWTAASGGSINNNQFFFEIKPGNIYDDICFQYSETYTPGDLSSEILLHDNKIPMHEYTHLSIKLQQPIDFALRSKLVFLHHIKATRLPGNNPQNAIKAKFYQGYAIADIRTFGSYKVVIDTTPPLISPMQKGNNFATLNKIQFSVKEDLTSIKEFRGEIDGKWICFSRKGNVFTYIFDEKCPKGKHNLALSVKDENDNTATYNLDFVR